MYSVLVLLLSAILSVSAAHPLRYTIPTFLDTPNNITSVVGSDVILPCSVMNLGPKHVIWKKLNIANAITISEFVYDPDKRYTVSRNDPYTDSETAGTDSQRAGHENPIWNLKISGVDFEHAGTYECQISTKEDFSRNVTLHIIKDRNQDTVKKTGIKLMGTHFVEKGATIDLNCTATDIDYRPKGVDWFKDGTRVKHGGRTPITEDFDSETNVLHSRLKIERVNMDDAGTYVCRFSQRHVESIKVIVLNTDSSNKRRDYGVNNEKKRNDDDGLDMSSRTRTENYGVNNEKKRNDDDGLDMSSRTRTERTGTEGLETGKADNQKSNSVTRKDTFGMIRLLVTLTLIYAILT